MASLVCDKCASFKLSVFFAIFAVLCFDIEGSRPGCLNDLGMESSTIKESQLSCYTFIKGWEPHQGRLNNNNGAWCSRTNDPKNEYFQIDLLRVRHVSAIETQGVKTKWVWSYYVKKYQIKYSYDGRSWFAYRNVLGTEETFIGNSDANTVKRNYFRDAFVTRYLRIYPKTFNRDMCLRVELYGCSDQADDCSRYITSPSSFITSPGHPASYPTNKDCTWLISVKSGKSIALMFRQFDVRRSSNPPSCNKDFVEVRDGLTDLSPQIGGKYCNGNTPMLITSGNVVRIQFRSGSGSSSIAHKRYFQIDYLSITPGSDDVLAAKACDKEVIALNCSRFDYTIHILYATYGSFPYSCGQQVSSTSCPAVNSKSQLMLACQDYKECHFPVNGPQFGYSCPNASAPGQLQVFYQCTSRNIKTPAPALPTTPAKPTQGSPVAPTTFQTTNPSSNPFTGNATGSPTLGHITEPIIKNQTTLPTEKPVVFTVMTDIPQPTNPVSSREMETPPVGGRQAQTGSGLPTGAMAGVIVAALIISVVVLLALVFIRRKRRKEKGSPLPSVAFTPEREYSVPQNCAKRRSPNSRGNPYETVNILYQSADNPDNNPSTCEKGELAYNSCSVAQSSPKITENPLYMGITPALKKNADEGYELIKPSSTASHNDDSGLEDKLPKVKSIINPNYEKTLPLTNNHEYAKPDSHA